MIKEKSVLFSCSVGVEGTFCCSKSQRQPLVRSLSLLFFASNVSYIHR